MTHGMDPAIAASRIRKLASTLRSLASGARTPSEAQTLVDLADEADGLAAVARPPRGHQFTASAQVLLHRDDLARNAFSAPKRGGIDVPEAYRGLEPALVAELSLVRTDLDALSPIVVDLLMAQGYFLTDFSTKLSMPELVFPDQTHHEWYDDHWAPGWHIAHGAIARANANRVAIIASIERESRRIGLLGGVPQARERWRYRAVLALVASPAIIAALTILATFALGVGSIVQWVVR